MFKKIEKRISQTHLKTDEERKAREQREKKNISSIHGRHAANFELEVHN